MADNAIKISNTDHFVPLSLLNNIISEKSFEPITIEEKDSELFFKTYNGTGRLVLKNNTIYEGNVRYGILHSEKNNPSYIMFPNGTEYKGDVVYNQLTGNGEYKFLTGSVYIKRITI